MTMDQNPGGSAVAPDRVEYQEGLLMDRGSLKLDDDVDRPDGAVDDGAPSRTEIIGMLNALLATELVCMLRYKSHYFSSDGIEQPKVAREFLGYAQEEAGHADRLARHIVLLGGQPDFSPDSLARSSFVPYDPSGSLQSMIVSDLEAERTVIERYREVLKRIGTTDPATRYVVQDILADEEDHALELSQWLGSWGNGGTASELCVPAYGTHPASDGQ
jgi:bacterioferritin